MTLKVRLRGNWYQILYISWEKFSEPLGTSDLVCGTREHFSWLCFYSNHSDPKATFDTFFDGNDPFREQYCDQRAARQHRGYEQKAEYKSKNFQSKDHSSNTREGRRNLDDFNQAFKLHIIKLKPKNKIRRRFYEAIFSAITLKIVVVIIVILLCLPF